MTDKYFKVAYNQSNNKLKILQIKTYAQLVEKVKALFKKLGGQFDMYYYDEEGDRFDIKGQYEFQIYLELQVKRKIFIKKEDQEYQPFQNLLNTSSILNSSLRSKEQTISQTNNQIENILQPKLSSTKSQPKPEIKPFSRISQNSVKKSQSNAQSTSIVQELIQNTQKPQQQSKKVDKIEFTVDIKQKKTQTFKSQIKLVTSPVNKSEFSDVNEPIKSGQQTVPYNKQSIESNKRIVHKISCNGCKSSKIMGNRWRCLQCIDIDFCDNCYNTRKSHVDHEFVMMDADDYVKKINFKTSINQLFNPNYRPQKSNNRQITAWISQEDIIQHKVQAISEIWKASDTLSKKMLEQFEQWNQKWQIQSKQ